MESGPSSDASSADPHAAAMADALRVLREGGLLDTADASITPLTGGVSSEIYLVEQAGRRFVFKRALEQLRVRDEWFADTARNVTEQAYLRYVGHRLPGVVPKVLGGDPAERYFVMEYLGNGFAPWKQELLAGTCDADTARRCCGTLAAVHAAARGDAEAERTFDAHKAFYDLRIEPYLLATAARHPGLRPAIVAEADRLGRTHETLVHGDYSPKNLLVGNGRVVIVDCEVADYGDPAFDVAFLLNHLLLKCVYHGPVNGRAFLAAARSAAAAYASALGDPAWADAIATRVARLLPMLLLARVDGKSPAEYLTGPMQDRVRGFAAVRIETPPAGLAALFNSAAGEWAGTA